MKLSELQLPSSVISSLYNKTLIETDEKQQIKSPVVEPGDRSITSTIQTTENTIKFLGENRKNILIAVSSSTTTFLPDEDLSFLTNMLGACKLGIADTAIINLNNIQAPSYKTIFEKLNSSIVLLFGIEPSALNLPVSFPQFQVQSFSNYTFLSAPSLSEIEQDKMLKSKLWVCLRRVFNV
ncbi:MAG: hypothetical protein QM764_24625 [Chitinophagaceae bacterium]